MDSKAAEEIYNRAATQLGYYIDRCLPGPETGHMDQGVPHDETEQLSMSRRRALVLQLTRATEHPNREQLDCFVKKMEEYGQAEDVITMYKVDLKTLEIEYINQAAAQKKVNESSKIDRMI